MATIIIDPCKWFGKSKQDGAPGTTCEFKGCSNSPKCSSHESLKSCKNDCTHYDSQAVTCSLSGSPIRVSNSIAYCSAFTKPASSANIPVASCKWKGVDVVDGAPLRSCKGTHCVNSPACTEYELTANLCRDCGYWGSIPSVSKQNGKLASACNNRSAVNSSHLNAPDYSYEDDTCNSFIQKQTDICCNCNHWVHPHPNAANIKMKLDPDDGTCPHDMNYMNMAYSGHHVCSRNKFTPKPVPAKANICRDCAKWKHDSSWSSPPSIPGDRVGHCAVSGLPYCESVPCVNPTDFAPKPVPTTAATCGNCDWWDEDKKSWTRIQSIKGAVVAIGTCANLNSGYAQSVADHICPQHKPKMVVKETCGTCHYWRKQPSHKNIGDCMHPTHPAINISGDTEPSRGCHTPKSTINKSTSVATKPPIGKEVPCKWASFSIADGTPSARCYHVECLKNSNWFITAKTCSHYEPEKQKQNEVIASVTDAHLPIPKPCERCESLTTNTFTIKFDNKFRKLCERCQSSFKWMMA